MRSFISMFSLSFSLIALTACGAGKADTTAHAAQGAEIKPTDFALEACQGLTESAPCTLVHAGGKRVLIGAPAGVTAALGADDMRALDAVLLFSLQSADIEGLGEVRNASWHAGRATPLPVSGPSGTRDVLAAINKTYEAADAAFYATHTPPGGFKSALLEPVAGEKETKAEVLNTGDLVITHIVNAEGQTGYWVDYEGHRAVIEPCGMGQASQFGGEAALTVACTAKTPDVLTWPLTGTHFVLRGEDTKTDAPPEPGAAVS